VIDPSASLPAPSVGFFKVPEAFVLILKGKATGGSLVGALGVVSFLVGLGIFIAGFLVRKDLVVKERDAD